MKKIALPRLQPRTLATAAALALSIMTLPGAAADTRATNNPCPAITGTSSSATAANGKAGADNASPGTLQRQRSKPQCRGAECDQSSTVTTGPGGLSSSVTVGPDGRLSGSTQLPAQLPGDATSSARSGNGKSGSSATASSSAGASSTGSAGSAGSAAASSSDGSHGSSAAASSSPRDGCANENERNAGRDKSGR